MKQWLKSIKLKNNEQGIALISVIMVLVIVSVLGVTLMGLAASNLKMSTGERSNQSTYYVAESGVAVMMNEVKKQILAAYILTDTKDDFYTQANENLEDNLFFEEREVNTINPNVNFEETYGGQPSSLVSVDIIDETNGKYKIVSKGTINNSTRVVEKEFNLLWVPKIGITLPNTAIFVDNNIKFESGSALIKGSIGTNSTEKNAIELHSSSSIQNGEIFVGPGGGPDVVNKYYPVIKVLDEKIPLQLKTFQATPVLSSPVSLPLTIHEKKGSTSVISKEVRSVGGNSVIGDLLINEGNNNSVTLDLASSDKLTTVTNSDGSTTYRMVLDDLSIQVANNEKVDINIGNRNVEIYVENDFTVSGTLNVLGTGSLTIYVKRNLSLHQGIINNISSNKAQINIFLRKSTTSVPKTISLTSSNTILNCNLYAEDAKFEFNGGTIRGQLITEGNLEMWGNNIIEGAVIAKNAIFHGNSQIEFVQAAANTPIPIEKSPLDPKFIDEKPTREK